MPVNHVLRFAKTRWMMGKNPTHRQTLPLGGVCVNRTSMLHWTSPFAVYLAFYVPIQFRERWHLPQAFHCISSRFDQTSAPRRPTIEAPSPALSYRNVNPLS